MTAESAVSTANADEEIRAEETASTPLATYDLASADVHSDEDGESANGTTIHANDNRNGIFKSAYASMRNWGSLEEKTHTIMRFVLLALSVFFVVMVFVSCCCCASRKLTEEEIKQLQAGKSVAGQVMGKLGQLMGQAVDETTTAPTKCKCFWLCTLFFLLGSVTSLFSVLMIFKNMWLKQKDEQEEEEEALLAEGGEAADAP